MIKSKKIFITGLNGSIAKSFIILLEKKNKKSKIYVSSRSNIKKIDNNNIKVIKLNKYYSNIENYQKIINECDYFFHLAYQNSEAFAEKYPYEDFKTNVQSLMKILKIVQNNKKLTFVFTSTVSIYKTSKKKINEKSKIQSLSVYNFHKHCCENLIRLYSFFSKNKFIILRLSNVYGDDDDKKRDFLLQCIKNIKNRKSINIYGNGKYYRDFIHIDDVSSALLKIVEKNKITRFNIYNICSGFSITIRDLINLLIKTYSKVKFDNNIKIRFSKNNTKLTKRNFFAKPIKFMNEFSWKPKIKLSNGVLNLIKRISDSL
tara:strand:- start:296 stop:1246 length:951 start_codon:yes stop_codon:yes gene_type:complete